MSTKQELEDDLEEAKRCLIEAEFRLKGATIIRDGWLKEKQRLEAELKLATDKSPQ